MREGGRGGGGDEGGEGEGERWRREVEEEEGGKGRKFSFNQNFNLTKNSVFMTSSKTSKINEFLEFSEQLTIKNAIEIFTTDLNVVNGKLEISVRHHVLGLAI